MGHVSGRSTVGVRGRVLEIVRTVLLNDLVKMEDNFFEAGGDSLTLLEVCSSIEDELQIDIPLESMWDASNIAELAAVVEKAVDERTS
jgi:acyl carrier protein